jgi:hypothetical protein
MSNKNSNDIFALPYAKWLEQTLQELVKFPVKGIAINAITDKGEVYTNYHNITMADKLVISGIINQDATLDMMAANGIVEYVDEEGGEFDGTEEE